MTASQLAGRRLAGWLRMQEKTQADVAEALHVTQATVSRWLVNGLPTRHLDPVARFMGTTPAGLLRAPEAMTPAVIGPAETQALLQEVPLNDEQRRTMHLIAGLPPEDTHNLSREFLEFLYARRTKRERRPRAEPD